MTDYEKIEMAQVAVKTMARIAKRNLQAQAVENWKEVDAFLRQLRQSYSQQPEK